MVHQHFIHWRVHVFPFAFFSKRDILTRFTKKVLKSVHVRLYVHICVHCPSLCSHLCIFSCVCIRHWVFHYFIWHISLMYVMCHIFFNHVFSTFRQSRDILHYFQHVRQFCNILKYISPTLIFIIMTYYDIYDMSTIHAHNSTHFNIYLTSKRLSLTTKIINFRCSVYYPPLCLYSIYTRLSGFIAYTNICMLNTFWNPP